MQIVASLFVLFLHVFTDDRIFMLLNAQVEMMDGVAYIIQITQITLKFIHSALLFHK